MNNEMKYVILVALVMIFTGCNKTEIGQLTKDDELNGKLVSVMLPLSVQAQLAPHRNGSRVVVNRELYNMSVELVENPIQKSKVVDSETIANVWIFQYNGTANNSVLIYKKYYPIYIAGAPLELASGTAQRVVVIANTYSATWGDTEILSNSTYQNLLNKSVTVIDESNLFTNGGNSMIMSGTQTGDITFNSTTKIELRRNVAQIIFRIKLGVGTTAITASEWSIRMCGVPDKSYFLPDYYSSAATTLYPISVTVNNLIPQTIRGINNQTFTDVQWYVPANRRGVVVGTTANGRKTNAPTTSTYIKIMGISPLRAVSYYIHLGANFAEDYNIRPNYRYTYNVTLYDVFDKTDSRVEVETNIVEQGDAAPRIFVVNADNSDNATLQLTKNPLNYGAMFQWMSTVAYNYGKTDPVYWTQMVKPLWLNTWVSDTNLTSVNILAGKGDPCRLVGYTAKEVRDAASKGIVLDNKKWKMADMTENSVFGTRVSTWFPAVVGVSSAGRYLGMSLGGGVTTGQFLPATGVRNSSGYSLRDVSGWYWSSTLNTPNVSVLSFTNTSVSVNGPKGMSEALSIRCVTQP